MNVTLSLEEDLVRKVSRIAAERDTTVTALVREYLQQLATDGSVPDRKLREQEALERSFQDFQFRVGRQTWKREDLHERP